MSSEPYIEYRSERKGKELVVWRSICNICAENIGYIETKGKDIPMFCMKHSVEEIQSDLSTIIE